MTPEAKAFMLEKWIPALRSGDYEQGQGVLKHIDTIGNTFYCCLGVLCVISDSVIQAGTNSGGEMLFIGKDDADQETKSGGSSYAVLPKQLSQKLGITPDGSFQPPYEQLDKFNHPSSYYSLTSLNDAAGFTFEDIADFVEHKILGPDAEYAFVEGTKS